MAKNKKMTYSYCVSIQGRPPQDISRMEDGERREIYAKIAMQYIENGLHGKIVADDRSEQYGPPY